MYAHRLRYYVAIICLFSVLVIAAVILPISELHISAVQKAKNKQTIARVFNKVGSSGFFSYFCFIVRCILFLIYINQNVSH